MVSDVEVASLLSGGVDSSYVACHFGGAKTFTVGFDYETYNEIPYAEALSKSLGIENISKKLVPAGRKMMRKTEHLLSLLRETDPRFSMCTTS